MKLHHISIEQKLAKIVRVLNIIHISVRIHHNVENARRWNNVMVCPHRVPIECCHCHWKHEAGTNKCKVFFAENYKRNEFLIRFMIDECGAASPYSVLNAPVPDGMSIDDDNICDEQVNIEK